MSAIGREHSFTRRELAAIVSALEEYEAECIPPRRDLSERVNAVLRGPGERFRLLSDEQIDAIHRDGFRQACHD